MQCFIWISVYSKCGPCIFPSEIANTVLMFCYYHYTRRWFSIIYHPLDFPSINRRKSEIMLHIISFKRRSTAYYKPNIESLGIRYLCCFMPIVNSVHWFNFVFNFFFFANIFLIFCSRLIFQLFSLWIREIYIKTVMNYPLHRLCYFILSLFTSPTFNLDLDPVYMLWY